MLYELFGLPAENREIPDLGTFNAFRDTKISFSSFDTKNCHLVDASAKLGLTNSSAQKFSRTPSAVHRVRLGHENGGNHIRTKSNRYVFRGRPKRHALSHIVSPTIF